MHPTSMIGTEHVIVIFILLGGIAGLIAGVHDAIQRRKVAKQEAAENEEAEAESNDTSPDHH